MPIFGPFKMAQRALRRVFSGRVTKRPRPPTKSPRAGRSPSPTRPPSSPQAQHPTVRIKEEDNDDHSFDVPANRLHRDDFVDSMNETLETTAGQHAGLDKDMEEDSDEDYTAVTNNETPSADQYFGLDEPIQSIEGNEDEFMHDKTPPYLHGKAHTNDGDEDEYSEDSLEDDPDEDLIIYKSDLREYHKRKQKIQNCHIWPVEAVRLHKLLDLRGLYPLMPSSWAGDLIDHPYLDGLFMPEHCEKKALLYAVTNQFRATRALRNLFELHVRISAYRQEALHDKISPLVAKEIKRYILWAERDGELHGLCRYVSPTAVITMDTRKVVSDEDKERLSNDIVKACRNKVQKYHAGWAELGVEDYPRFIYAFVIIQQVVIIMFIDADQGATATPIPITDLDMSKKNYWLDASLGIAIPVMLAREALLDHGYALEDEEDVEQDPDE